MSKIMYSDRMTVEEKIIRGCLAGKRKYQNMLFGRYAPVLLACCMRYCPDRDTAEDVLQEGFIKVFNNIGSFRGEGSFEGWLKRIMVNTAINFQKQIKKNRQFEELDSFESGNVLEEHYDSNLFPDPEYEEKISSGDVLKMIQEMPEGYRMVMNLYVFEGFTHKEIGNLLGIAENTSKSQLSKARQYLKKELLKNTKHNKEYV